MDTNKILDTYLNYKESSISGRYINYQSISPILKKWKSIFNVTELGRSENNLPINLITIGTGKKKILLWSQMHGNESTTTRAVFDLLNLLNDTNNSLSTQVLKECTLYIVPMLNPDGSNAYTRANYRNVDLNRDAQVLTQKESQIFKKLVDFVNPLIAFNLHGQRTIFSVGNTNKSAIVSFLSPASNPKRSITESRKKGMQIIAEMNNSLQQVIPNSVGRYDDGFNLNCTGDTLENRGITTILFEAGHYPNDYERETTRKWIYLSLVTSIYFISKNIIDGSQYERYFDIPENGKCFNDIIIRNYDNFSNKTDIAIQYKEILIGGKLLFKPYIIDIQPKITNFGHLEFNASVVKINLNEKNEYLKINNEIDIIKINDKEFSVFPIKH